MALRGKAFDIFLELYFRKFFENINSVIDMGDQDLSVPFDEIKKKFSRVNIKIDEDLYEAAKNFPKRPRISSS